MADVTLHQLPPSPNNMKVRIALTYKGIPYDTVDVPLDDQERSQIVQLSGQPLTPVLRHGDVVVSDSAAIMRYLEANFRDTPKILFADRARMNEAEQLEKWIKSNINEPVGMAFSQLFSEQPDLAVCEQASALMNQRTGKLEQRLQHGEWLIGEAMSFVDITAAPFVFYSMVPESLAGQHPAVQFLHAHLHLGEGRDRTRDWCMRVMSYDRAELFA